MEPMLFPNLQEKWWGVKKMECDLPKFEMKKYCERMDNEKRELVFHNEKIMSIVIILSSRNLALSDTF
jgi:hypothetical protein